MEMSGVEMSRDEQRCVETSFGQRPKLKPRIGIAWILISAPLAHSHTGPTQNIPPSYLTVVALPRGG